MSHPETRTALYRRLLPILALFLGGIYVDARQVTPPTSHRQAGAIRPLAGVRQLVLPATDVPAELAFDTHSTGKPLRFAAATEVRVSPQTDGTWEEVPRGRLWRLRVVSAGATDLNFALQKFALPEGATLHFVSEERNYYQGPYTSKDNKEHGQLWSPVIPGGRVVIELFVPEATEEPSFVLAQVGRGYRTLFKQQSGGETVWDAGACNIDVVCPQGAAWSNEVRSVALISIQGVGFCTGTLVNNARGDLKPYFLTASHCQITPDNASSVVVYWNFQSPACGQHGGGSMDKFQTGATFRAAKVDADLTLIELEDMPEPANRVYYSGWDRSGSVPGGAVAIHHPSSGEKMISFSSNTLQTVNSCFGSGVNTHWRVVWSQGVTEIGSSGCGLWNPATHLLIGVLTDGVSGCSNPGGADCFGKFSVAWGSGSTPATRLRDWLDPDNSGIVTLAGRDSRQFEIVPAGGTLVSEGCFPTNGVIDPGETVTVRLGLRNLTGTNVTVSAALLEEGGVVMASSEQTYSNLVPAGPAVERTFSFQAGGLCGGAIANTLLLRIGTMGIGTATFVFPIGSTPLMEQNFDQTNAPALPVGWSSSGNPGWQTSALYSHTPTNSAFAPNPAQRRDFSLTAPALFVSNGNTRVTFHHRFQTEEQFDGGVLEIATNGGVFRDILSAGGAFLTGGYNGAIIPEANNALAGRPTWTGDSGTNFLTTIAVLPQSTVGKIVTLRWRMATDENLGGNGWYIDTVAVAAGCCQTLVPPQIIGARQAPGSITFSFQSVSGQTYAIEGQTVFGSTNWTHLQTIAGDGSLKTVTNTITLPARFYRIKTE